MSYSDWPGAGPTPEPEPEGFREEQIAAEHQRQIDEEQAAQDAALQQKRDLSGNPNWPDSRPEETPPPEGGATKSKSTKSTSSKSDTKDSHSH